ncbi:MAG: hypothetical protein GXO29_04260 [Thermotogae bacterium]|nr:hypothetical protein [Thermotogota bacterium]
MDSLHAVLLLVMFLATEGLDDESLEGVDPRVANAVKALRDTLRIIMSPGDDEEYVRGLKEHAHALRGAEDDLALQALVYIHLVRGAIDARERRFDDALREVSMAKEALANMDEADPTLASMITLLEAEILFRTFADSALAKMRGSLEEIMQNEEIPILLRNLAQEVLIYMDMDISSDTALPSILNLLGRLDSLSGIEAPASVTRMMEMLDVLMARLAYEIKAGRVPPGQVEWLDLAESTLSKLESMLPKAPLIHPLYLKLLYYLSHRSAFLDGDDPLNLGERVKRVKKVIEEALESALNAVASKVETEREEDETPAPPEADGDTDMDEGDILRA